MQMRGFIQRILLRLTRGLVYMGTNGTSSRLGLILRLKRPAVKDVEEVEYKNRDLKNTCRKEVVEVFSKM